MVSWEFLSIVIGFAYGFFAHGKQDKSELFKKGIMIGIVIGLILGLIVLLTGSGFGVAAFLGALLSAFIITLFFILGVWLGDVLEPKTRRR